MSAYAMSHLKKASPWIAALVLSTLTGIANAHDFWITPSAFRGASGQDIDFTLKVGHGGEAVSYGRKTKHLKRFWMVDPEGTVSDVPPAPEDTPGASPVDETNTEAAAPPAGRVTLRTPGVHIVGYRSHQTEIELDAQKFEGYLREEGLSSIIADRARRGESDSPGREVYSRSCKTMMLAQHHKPRVSHEGFDRLIGLPVEITPHTDPFALHADDELVVSVHHGGKPAVGVQVDAEQWSETAERIHLKATTDDQGRATFNVSRAGVWLITTTHMVRALPDTRADWQSIWGSLTIEVLEATAESRSRGDTDPAIDPSR